MGYWIIGNKRKPYYFYNEHMEKGEMNNNKLNRKCLQRKSIKKCVRKIYKENGNTTGT